MAGERRLMTAPSCGMQGSGSAGEDIDLALRVDLTPEGLEGMMNPVYMRDGFAPRLVTPEIFAVFEVPWADVDDPRRVVPAGRPRSR